MNYILFDKINKTLTHTEFKSVIDDLYYDKKTVPTKEQITNYIKHGKDKHILAEFKENDNDPDKIIKNIKEDISKIDHKVPLYDEYTKNLYIIPKEYVYNKVVHQSYRFPNAELKHILKTRRDELKPTIEKLKKTNELSEQNLSEFEKSPLIHYNMAHKKATKIREYNKLILMLNFLKQFNIETLETTYITVFYFYSNEVGKDITVCKRPSFLPHFEHIDPYYRRGELINMALNMQLIKADDKYYDQKEVMKLCGLIKKNDISADTLMKHQDHIIKNNKIGIIRYYSLHGSYFINTYLRDMNNDSYENKILENIIIPMHALVATAPAFDKEYILYRFVNNDSFIKNIKIGDIFIDPSFISTTRNPFYRSDLYKFGFILIKIKIPAKMIGVGLCIETYSDFPDEQEIILNPFSRLVLDKKDDDAIYYHHDNEKTSQVTTKYEFTFLGSDKLSLIKKRPISHICIDFLKLTPSHTITLYEKIKIFMDNYVDEIAQFETLIGNKLYTVITEWYNSTNTYKDFYAVTKSNGFSLYTISDGYILFFIELAEENDYSVMYVNYYFSKSTGIGKNIIPDADLINFLAKLAYYFGIRDVIMYASYESCDVGKIIKREREGKKESKDMIIYKGGNYCIDFYEYLKNKNKRFNNKNIIIDSTEVKPKFSYYQLDRLRNMDPMLIISRTDPNEIYQIYTKTYKVLVEQTKHNLADFYVWLAENQCTQLTFLIKNMHKIYEFSNPFENDYYILDSAAYLNNRNLISDYMDFPKNKNLLSNVSNKPPNKNNYRIPPTKHERINI